MITYFVLITVKFDFDYYTVYISKIIYVENVTNVTIFLFKMIPLELCVQVSLFQGFLTYYHKMHRHFNFDHCGFYSCKDMSVEIIKNFYRVHDASPRITFFRDTQGHNIGKLHNMSL